MAQIKFPGLAEYERKLSRLSRAVKDEIAAKAIYAGADIVADEVRSAIEGLPIVTGYGTAEHIAALKKYGPTPIHRRSFIGHFVG